VKFMLRAFSAFTAATVLALAAVSISATSSDANTGSRRFLCNAFGAGDTDFSAEYEERVTQRGTSATLHAKFETSTRDGFVAGQPVVFSVDTVVVGTVALGSGGPGELRAELRLDSKADGRGHEKPFPPTFPGIQAGSVLKAAAGGTLVLGCLLTLV
jgi:hypothetical protein